LELLRGFNPRPRVGGDVTNLLDFAIVHVSTHAPAWGATGRGSKGRRGIGMFQPTPPRGGRPDLYHGLVAIVVVSTHAPAWGATKVADDVRGLRHVSTHAPAWGATRFYTPTKTLEYVSTHAPAWGATRRASRSSISVQFQPTPPRGGRPGVMDKLLAVSVSTHAPAWGAT